MGYFISHTSAKLLALLLLVNQDISYLPLPGPTPVTRLATQACESALSASVGLQNPKSRTVGQEQAARNISGPRPE